MEQTTTTTERSTDINCRLCERIAVAIDRSGRSLCARHATIFVTVTDRYEDGTKKPS